MIRTLAWKDLREHCWVWTALYLLELALLGGGFGFLEPAGEVQAGSEKAAILLAIGAAMVAVYGLVCGAMLLAGEREAATLPFLDSLAGQRRPLWQTKRTVGTALTLGFALASAPLVATLGATWGFAGPAWMLGPVFFAYLALLGLTTFSWGMLASAVCPTTLAAVGVVLVIYPLIALAGGAPAVYLAHLLEADPISVYLGVQGVVALAALSASGWIFCRDDRQRQATPTHRWAREAAGCVSCPWKPLLWLVWRQWHPINLLVVAVAAAIWGLMLAQLDQDVWAMFTVVLGVIGGTMVFHSEQTEGSWRFLGDQRLPLGRFWTVKVLCGFGVTVLTAYVGLAAANLAAPRWTGTADGGFGLIPGRWISADVIGPWTFFFVWLIYGFSMGHFFALLVRKSVTAIGLALLVCVSVLALWLPSLALGGLNAWQLFGVPLLLVVAGRLALRPWVGDRLRTWKPALALAGCGILACAWVASCLAYRVVEVPNVGEPFDVRAFEAGLPTLEQNRSGRMLRQAAQELRRQWDRDRQANDQHQEQLLSVLASGWPEPDHDLGAWLDRLCAGDWFQHLREAVALPPGMIVDPRTAEYVRQLDEQTALNKADWLLRARAVQLQARGDAAAALDHLVSLLALSRQVRQHAPVGSYLQGQRFEQGALLALASWQRRLEHQPQLLARALDELTRHEARTPPLSDQVKTEYVHAIRISPEASGVNLALVPWEQARLDRIRKLAFRAWLDTADMDYWQLLDPVAKQLTIPPQQLQYWQPGDAIPSRQMERLIRPYTTLRAYRQQWPDLLIATAQAQRDVRLARLGLALALYQEEHGGHVPQTAAELAPRYVSEVPIDPLTGCALHLRDLPGPAPESLPPPREEAK